jgi:hypothetical protein
MKIPPVSRSALFHGSATSDDRIVAVPVCLLLAAGLVLLVGCSSTPDIEELPPQTLTDGPSDLTEAPVVASNEGVSALDLAPTESPEEQQPTAGTLIAIGARPAPDAPTDMRARLLEASRRETERRRNASAPVVVINDKNLAEMAEGGNVTIASPPRSADRVRRDRDASSTRSESRTMSPSELLERDIRNLSPQEQEEVYWRKRARQLRSDWRDAWESIPTLEAEASALRQQFYSEDDPFVRDSRVKPAWDRALDRLQSARVAMTEYESRVQDLMDEGRRAGAPPGWLREGKELEPPVQSAPPEIETTDTIEPPEYRRPPG